MLQMAQTIDTLYILSKEVQKSGYLLITGVVLQCKENEGSCELAIIHF